jgi:serine/threonine protein kinase/Flp pilus assembly protein TadD
MKTERFLLALPDGYQLGKYLIEGVLGSGGFGITYLAEDTSLGRRVAIKELLPGDFATRVGEATVAPKGRETDRENLDWAQSRFMEEGRVLAACPHPNVVEVYEAFSANGTAYLVTRYEEGEDLERWLRGLGRAPTEAELIAILWPLLSGLERVHQAGFLHRDLKPENIYLTRGGRPVLLDFGSARQAIGGRSRMLTAILTTGYAPFEQYHEGGRQGPWTDIYALGAVMHRAITGQKPPEAAARMMGNDPYKSLAATQASRYSAALLKGLDQALRVKASERPQSIAQWRALLGKVAPRPDDQRRGKGRLEAEVRQRESKGREQQKEENVPPIFTPNRSPKTAHPPGAKVKWPAAVALAIALMAGIGAIWFTLHREQTVALVAPTPTPAPTPAPAPRPTPTPTSTFVGNAQAAFNLGDTYFFKKEYDMAIIEYTEAIRLKPDYADAYFSRGASYLFKGDYDHAIADYTEAIRLQPDFAHAYYGRANAYSQKANYDQAIIDYTEAIRLKSDFIYAYAGRGNAYYGKANYDQAIVDYTEAIRLDPKDASYYGDRGNAYYIKADYDRAIIDYTEAIRLDPKDATYWGDRGNAYYGKGNYDQAIVDYTEAIRLDPKNATYYEDRGNAYNLKKQTVEALVDFAKAEQLRKAAQSMPLGH